MGGRLETLTVFSGALSLDGKHVARCPRPIRQKRVRVLQGVTGGAISPRDGIQRLALLHPVLHRLAFFRMRARDVLYSRMARAPVAFARAALRGFRLSVPRR